MSLDVSLLGPVKSDVCGECGNEKYFRPCLFDANITHNLGRMAEAAGIYKAVWRPEEIDINFARDLIEPLSEGISRLKADPETFKKFDSPNGWGTYENFVPWLEEYLEACKKYPYSSITVCR